MSECQVFTWFRLARRFLENFFGILPDTKNTLGSTDLLELSRAETIGNVCIVISKNDLISKFPDMTIERVEDAPEEKA